jgi:hypothetical protein
MSALIAHCLLFLLLQISQRHLQPHTHRVNFGLLLAVVEMVAGCLPPLPAILGGLRVQSDSLLLLDHPTTRTAVTAPLTLTKVQAKVPLLLLVLPMAVILLVVQLVVGTPPRINLENLQWNLRRDAISAERVPALPEVDLTCTIIVTATFQASI